jgi:hypothetical protein
LTTGTSAKVLRILRERKGCMKRVCLLNGSLRGEKASSLQFLDRVAAGMKKPDVIVDRVALKAGAGNPCARETLALVAGADVIVLAFPLFVYTLPGAATRFLEDFYSYAKAGGAYNSRVKVFAIINCGFPEPWTMREAARVVRNFCARLELEYGFSIAISSGPVSVMTMKVPFLNPRLKKAFRALARDALGDDQVRREDFYIKPIIPRQIVLKMKEHYERKLPALRPPTVARDPLSLSAP